MSEDRTCQQCGQKNPIGCACRRLADWLYEDGEVFLELSVNELATLYFDAGATFDGPWPPPVGEVTDEARQAYKRKVTEAIKAATPDA